jgi:hypothetical protein
MDDIRLYGSATSSTEGALSLEQIEVVRGLTAGGGGPTTTTTTTTSTTTTLEGQTTTTTTTTTSTTTTLAPAANGLAGYWKLDEGSGTDTADQLDGTATLNGASLPAWQSTADSRIGASSLSFDTGSAQNSRVNSTATSLAQSVTQATITAWIYWSGSYNSSGGLQPILFFSTASNADGVRLMLCVNNTTSGANGNLGCLRIQAANSADDNTAANSKAYYYDSVVPSNTWLHVAAAVDWTTGAMQIFVNGVSQTLTATTLVGDLSSGTANSASAGVAIGNLASGTYGRNFRGRIDDVRYYRNRILSAGEIALLAKPVSGFLVTDTSGNPIGNQVVGTPFNIKLTAVDNQNATVAGFDGTGCSAEITAAGATLSAGGGTTAIFSSGVLSSHAVNFSTTGLGVTLSAQMTGATDSYDPKGTSAGFDVGGGWPPPPAICAVTSFGGSNVALQVDTVVGATYILNSTPALAPPPVVWTPVATNAGTGGRITNSAPIEPGTSQSFFRYHAQ